jgi:putative serine protease PepD
VQAASTGGGLDGGSVLAAIEPAVVDIQASSLRGSGQGTGIVYSGDGLVLTNAHVVAGATRVTVTTATDRTARSAQVLGSDPTHDIALVKIDDPSNLVVAKLGESKSVRVGADVVAIGNALGLRGDPSVTRGIVSALDRSIGDLTGMLQTDAAINPGNSGGPLVNANGEVIGINTAIAVEDGAQNIGFAIPIDAARTIAERLRSGAPAAPGGFLGVSTRDAETATTGAEVVAVTSGSPASDAGIQPGDVIVAVDGTAITGAADLSRIVGDHKPGDGIDVTVVRNGQEKHMTAKLGSK